MNQIQPQQQMQNVDSVKFNDATIFAIELTFNDDFDSGKQTNLSEGFKIVAKIPTIMNEAKKEFLNTELYPYSIINQQDGIDKNDKYLQFTENGTNPYKSGILAKYVEGYLGKTEVYYEEMVTESQIGESGSQKYEQQYNKTTIGERHNFEIYTKFEIIGDGNFSDRNTKIKENKITHYDLTHQNVLEMVLVPSGIENYKIREMTDKEKENIPLEVMQLRSEVYEKAQKSLQEKGLDTKTIIDEKNPIPKPDDGKGSIDLDKLQEKVKQMTEGYKLEVKNEAQYANIETGIDNKSRA